MAISGVFPRFGRVVETGANLAGFSVFGLAWFLLVSVSTFDCLQHGTILACDTRRQTENK
jgi:hypothetical protein